MTRSLKQDNYFVLETQAQAFPEWTPYPKQLRLQAFSHLGSGASMVAYWHWHSIHNSFETYWKGLLSHDFLPNPVYKEARTIGADFKRLSDQLIGLKKTSKVAVMVSNEALSAIEWFKLPGGVIYNDVVRWMYDEFYRMNIACDFIQPSCTRLSDYELIVVPALYAVSDEALQRLNEYVRSGGHAVYSFKSGFTDEQVKVRHSAQPGVIHEACGVAYSHFATPNASAGLTGKLFPEGTEAGVHTVRTWMEMLVPDSAEVLASYDHPQWGEYAAVTRNSFGDGTATYIGCMTEPAALAVILRDTLQVAGLWGEDQQLSFPLIVKSGVNRHGSTIRYYYNYSAESVTFQYPHGAGQELLSGNPVAHAEELKLEAWGVFIISEG